MPNINLSNLSGEGISLTDPDFDARIGFSVASAGDVNGDGFDDILIGAPGGYNFYYGNSEARTYLVFGKAGGFADVSLSIQSLTASQGFIIEGAVNTSAGQSVSSAGDINGDGYDDFIVGAPGITGFTGRAYVFFGKASGFANLDLAEFTAGNGFFIEGDFALDNAGFSVASAGDINNDGYDDIIIAAPFGDNGGDAAGEAYVIFGKASGFGNIDLTDLAASAGFVVQGAAPGDTAGMSVASAGDVNGDGYDDIIVGAPNSDVSGNFSGAAYVIFGKASGFGNINLANLSLPAGFVIRGAAAEDFAGRSVASAGDVNGDGYGDIIVGAPLNDAGGDSSGLAYVIFGKASGFDTIYLASLSATAGFRIQGDAPTDQAGFSVASAGDINGDGYGDIIVGAPGNDAAGGNAGSSYVILGKAGGFADIDLSSLSPDAGFRIFGEDSIDNAGTVASAGDVNGDGFDDILVGAPYARDFVGAAYLIFGPVVGETIVGGAGDDVLVGTTGGDNLSGQGGSDSLQGLGGSDILDGGAGADTLRGGLGHDLYLIHDVFDTIVELAGEGDDRLVTSVSYTLANGVSIETITTNGDAGTTAINITGNEFVQSIYGNAGNNTLSGGGGADHLVGQGGEDTYVVGHSSVTIGEVAGGGDDRLVASVSYTLTAGAHVETMTTNSDSATAGISLAGNDVAQSIYGNAGVNVLSGDGGNDNLNGLAGNDFLNGGSGNDVLNGGADRDEYRFTTSLNAATNVDIVVGFVTVTDGISLDDAAFTALAMGPLSAAAFRTGSSALDADDRIVYDNTTGALFYDADGVGGAAQIQFATLQGAPVLAASDFAVV